MPATQATGSRTVKCNNAALLSCPKRAYQRLKDVPSFSEQRPKLHMDLPMLHTWGSVNAQSKVKWVQ